MAFTRQNQFFRITAWVLTAYLAIAAAIAATVPLDGKSFLASFVVWLVAIPVVLIIYVTLELTGTWTLGLQFWQRMPGAARVPLLVLIIVLACIAVAIAAVKVGQFVAL